jgi:plasmid stabilization system protein ParE
VASRVAVDIASAARRAARTPDSFPWVGGVYDQLDAVPRSVRRVLTRSGRHILYFRHQPDTDEVIILAVRGPGQLPPTPVELSGNAL